MRTRTWLTTPPDQAPVTDARDDDGERYVPAPGLPTEPRVPGPHRRAVVLITTLVVGIMVVATLVLVGEQAQREDPSVPQAPDGPQAPDAPQPPELPES